MKKIFSLVAMLMFCLCVPLTASAMDEYLNGDPNFPLTGGYRNFWEYTDLSSCTIAEENDDIVVGKVDVDEAEEITEKYGISSIPTLMVFKNGEVAETFVGVTTKDKILAALK